MEISERLFRNVAVNAVLVDLFTLIRQSNHRTIGVVTLTMDGMTEKRAAPKVRLEWIAID